MLNVYYLVCSELLLQVNPRKCHFIAFVLLHVKQVAAYSLDLTINWTHSVKYLGVHIVCRRNSVSTIILSSKHFYCNTVCSQSRYTDEILQLLLKLSKHTAVAVESEACYDDSCQIL